MSEFQALVESNRRINETVENKVNEIDAAVQAAIKAIPELHKAFYVDYLSGSNSNLGTQSEPIKTIYEAVKRTPSNGSATIYLAKNQDHYMSENNAIFTDATNKTITLKSYGTGTKPVIKMAISNSEVNGSIIHGFMVSEHSRITVVECIVDTMEFPLGQTKPYNTWGGFVSRNGSLGEVGSAEISLSHSEILLRDHHFSSHYTRVDYNFRAVIIHHVGNQVGLNSGGDTFYCTMNGVSLTDDTKTLKDCLVGATENNTLTNISLAAV